MGDSRWYQTGPLYQLYEDELGPEKAREKFTKDIKFLASTSQGMSLPNNVRVSSYYQYLDEQGLPAGYPAKGIRVRGQDPARTPKRDPGHQGQGRTGLHGESRKGDLRQ